MNITKGIIICSIINFILGTTALANALASYDYSRYSLLSIAALILLTTLLPIIKSPFFLKLTRRILYILALAMGIFVMWLLVSDATHGIFIKLLDMLVGMLMALYFIGYRGYLNQQESDN